MVEPLKTSEDEEVVIRLVAAPVPAIGEPLKVNTFDPIANWPVVKVKVPPIVKSPPERVTPFVLSTVTEVTVLVEGISKPVVRAVVSPEYKTVYVPVPNANTGAAANEPPEVVKPVAPI